MVIAFSGTAPRGRLELSQLALSAHARRQRIFTRHRRHTHSNAAEHSIADGDER